MTVKNLVTAALAVFVLVSLGVFVANETGRRETPSGQEEGTATQAASKEGTTAIERPDETPRVTPALPEAPSVETAQTSEFVQEAPEETKAIQVIAYYFHNTARCKTCLKIERTAREAMEETFLKDFASGKLVWQSLNMEKPKNEHFVYDYELAVPSLVLVLMEEEAEVDWKRLNDSWTLIRDKQRFVSYVVEETKAYLGVH